MEQTFIIREIIISNFKKYESYILFGLRFLVGLIIYSQISKIGFAAGFFDVINSRGGAIFYILFMALLFAIIPLEFSYFLMILNVTMQFSLKIEVALIVFMVLMLVFCFYAHLGTKEVVLILGLFFAYYFKMPYIIPIFAGLYMPVFSVIPILLTTILWYLYPLALEFAKIPVQITDMSFIEIPALFSEIYKTSLDYLEKSYEIGVFSFVLILMFLVVYLVSKLNINYKKEMAIISGVGSCIIFLPVAVLFTGANINIFTGIVFLLISGAICYVITFFDTMLDYQKVETVEFLDDEYYYHVKMIPKINKREPKPNKVKRASNMRKD